MVARGACLGFPVVDPLGSILVAVVAETVLGICLAVALVVVASMAVVHSLAHLGLVVGAGVVGLVGLALVVASVDFLAALVVHRFEARSPVA